MRRICTLLVCALLTGCHSTGIVLDSSLWQNYREAFITPEGRVVDNGNGNVSHSEGQGYGMLLAVAAADPQTFAQLWRWTQSHLAVRDDALLAWRWIPDASNHVPDRNNATDGDLLVAWALTRAAQRFRQPGYGEEAQRIAAAVRSQLLRKSRYGALLLPGRVGFESADGMIVNPSYLLFPAFRELQQVDPSPQWHALEEGGFALLRAARARYGPLPPDWIAVNTKGLHVANRMPLRSGYDALRVPLYCYWGGVEEAIDMPGIASRWQYDAAPAWVSLEGEEHSVEGLSSAHLAVRRLVRGAIAKQSWQGGGVSALPSDYYGATLSLLVELAWKERHE